MVPVLVEKLPKSIKYNMVRSWTKRVLEWELDELIKQLDLELEVHETNSELMKFDVGYRPRLHCYGSLFDPYQKRYGLAFRLHHS